MDQAARRDVLAAALGAALGLLGATVVLVGSGLVLLPWAAAGLAIGASQVARASAVRAGAAYGFALAFVFMVASYDGHAGVLAVVLLVLVCSCIGAAAGAALGLLGRALRR